MLCWGRFRHNPMYGGYKVGGGEGQYVEYSPEISKNQGLANFNILTYFLKIIMCIW